MATKKRGADQNSVQSARVDTMAGAVAPTAAVRRALAACDASLYPDPLSADLRRRLQHAVGVDADRIVVSNGASELAHLLARSVGPGSLAFVPAPADPEWDRAARLAGLITASHPADQGGGFDLSGCCARIAQLKPAIVFVASPNPVTGRALEASQIGTLLEASGQGLLVIDDSLACFAASSPDLREWMPSGNFVLIRSLAPAFGLGGLRIGHAVANPKLAAALTQQQARWSVSAVAQAAAAAALDDIDRYRDAWVRVRRQRDAMNRGLARAGFATLASDADFVAVEIDDAEAHAERMGRAHARVAAAGTFGMPRLLRIGVRAAVEAEALIASLAVSGERMR